eukprot:gene17877-18270_t
MAVLCAAAAAAALSAGEPCGAHPSCAPCLKDPACGWCTGDIGGGNPGHCVANASTCDTIFEKKSCPDCHLPWIRFANAIPTDNTIDCTITQGNKSRTWTAYKFAQFSDWSQDFQVGQGTIALSSGGKPLYTATRLLTPGPLVVVVKEDPGATGWPPRTDGCLETIAASYPPIPSGTAGVRLFDLSPGTSAVGMKTTNQTLTDGVKYSLGSEWVGVTTETQEFGVFDDRAGALVSLSYTPPRGASTLFLLGEKGQQPYVLRPEIDAPSVCGGDTEPPSPA